MEHVSKSAGNGSATGSALQAIPARPRIEGPQQVRQLGDLMCKLFELGRVLQQLGITLIEQSDDDDVVQGLNCRALAEHVVFLSSVGMQVASGHTVRDGADEWLLPRSLHAAPAGQLSEGDAA